MHTPMNTMHTRYMTRTERPADKAPMHAVVLGDDVHEPEQRQQQHGV